jgi:chromosomal replication initiator protein
MEVIHLIADKVPNNIRELEGAFNRVVAHGNLLKRTINTELAHEVLKDILNSKENQPNAEIIKKLVCKHFGIKVSDIESPKRARNYSYPRQIAMYLCRTLTDQSLPNIGTSFGNRDHTTVLHAINKIEAEKNTDNSVVELLNMFEENIINA